MPVITCIDDLKRMHRRRTPKMFFDYCESGSYSEQTFRDNVSDFGAIRLRLVATKGGAPFALRGEDGARPVALVSLMRSPACGAPGIVPSPLETRASICTRAPIGSAATTAIVSDGARTGNHARQTPATASRSFADVRWTVSLTTSFST